MIILNKIYVINGYIFRLDEADSNENYYFTIIHPDGRYLDRHHKFSSENEMNNWVCERGKI